MVSGGWTNVTNEAPCSICGKSDWCSVSSDGTRLICRRKDNGSGLHRVDKAGQEYWLYELNGSRPSESVDVPPKGSEATDKADPETLDQVYGALLNELPLSRSDRQALHRRELSEGDIKRHGYRTLPPDGREELAAKMIDRFGAEICSRVPGFYKKGDDSAFLSFAGASGLVIPVREIEGRIVALKARTDDTSDNRSRYTYISSSKHGGLVLAHRYTCPFVMIWIRTS